MPGRSSRGGQGRGPALALGPAAQIFRLAHALVDSAFCVIVPRGCVPLPDGVAAVFGLLPLGDAAPFNPTSQCLFTSVSAFMFCALLFHYSEGV